MNSFCQILLTQTRKDLNAKAEEKIDKRYYTTTHRGKQYLAPDNQYYVAHCGYCAEVAYLHAIHNERE